MKKFLTTALCAASIVTVGTAFAADNYIHLTRAEDFPELIKNDRVVAIFVYPPGQPCKNMMNTAARVAKEDAKTLFVIIDIRSYPQLRGQYGVGRPPSLILFRNGSELARSTGQRDANSLKAFMAKTFLGAKKAFISNPLAYTAAWIKGHFTIDPVCENVN